MSAAAIIGVKILLLESYFKQNRKPGCHHDFLDDFNDDSEVRFCPKCGREIIIEVGKLVTYETVDGLVEHLEARLKNQQDWLVINTYDDLSDGDVDEDNGYIFVGVGVEDDEFSMVQLPHLARVQIALEELLKHYGLYESEDFGLYAINTY